MSHRSVRAVSLLLATPLLAASCYSFAEPSYHPGDARQVMSAISRRGMNVTLATAGDSACDDPNLVPNAMHLQGTFGSDATIRDVWIYTFREKYWSTSQAAVDACQAAFQSAHPHAVVTRMDIPTYRVFGADWPTQMVDAVRGGLSEAAQAGEQ